MPPVWRDRRHHRGRSVASVATGVLSVPTLLMMLMMMLAALCCLCEAATPPTATVPPTTTSAVEGGGGAGGTGATTASTGATGPGAAAASHASSSFNSSSSNSSVAAAGNATGQYYFDTPPPTPFNLKEFLKKEGEDAITRVVDFFLLLTGEAGAQPVLELPGPLVDQPERRRPGQRWPLPPPPQLPSASEQQQQSAAAAADATRAAAAIARGWARNATAGAANATSDALGRRRRRTPGGLGGNNSSRSSSSSGDIGNDFIRAIQSGNERGGANSSSGIGGNHTLPPDLFGGLAAGLSPEAAAAALAAPANAAAAAFANASAAAASGAGANAGASAAAAPPPFGALPPVPSSRDLFGRLLPNSSSSSTRRQGGGGGSGKSFPTNSSGINGGSGAALRSNSTNAADGNDDDGDDDDINDNSSSNNPLAGAANALAGAATTPPPLPPNPLAVGTTTVPARPGQLPRLTFAGGGALFLFHAGVIEGLTQAGLFVPGVSTTSGFSGGAFAAAVLSAGVDPRRILELYDAKSIFCNATLPEGWSAFPRPPSTPARAAAELKATWKECLRTAAWPLDGIGAAVRDFVSPEALANVSRTTQIWASEVSPYFYYAQRSAPLGPYRDVDDLAAKVMASATLPCLVTPRTYTEIDGRPFIDGGYTTSTNQLCIGATDGSPCVTVTATYYGPHGWVPISRPRNSRLSMTSDCDDSVLVPPVLGLQARPPIGYGPHFSIPIKASAVLGGSLTTRPQLCTVPDMIDFFVISDRQALPPPGFPGWAINPGKRTPMPPGVSICDFQGYIMKKANKTISRAIYEHGKAEALAFAAEVYGK